MTSQSPPHIPVSLLSFGFKHGPPEAVNLLFDARFLPNPYYLDALREQTGLDDAASSYALGNDAGREFLQHLTALLLFLAKRFQEAGKEELAVAIGCTGGRHRSVAVVEALRRPLLEHGLGVQVSHRDIDKH